ncbi:recombination protein RecR [Deltaproteobacteria bacterium PRO3]|nr:recombination protein RecR [Deltaproteobacteria bacterium PRO3]
MASPIDRLVHYLSQLPGIGEKTATRLTFFILRQKPGYAKELSAALADLHDKVSLCKRCQNLTEQNPCRLCADLKRDAKTVLVVETPQDLLAIERSQSYRGQYHILHGAISPLEGVGPDDLKIAELLARLSGEGLAEVILATNPNVEGEATALYLMKILAPLGVKVTRIASGVPVGGGIEYLDPLTLKRAIEGRR